MSNLKLPWCSLRLCPVTCYLGEELDSHLAAPSYQGVVENKKVTPGPSLLQVKTQLPQPLLITLVIQPLPQLCCPPLVPGARAVRGEGQHAAHAALSTAPTATSTLHNHRPTNKLTNLLLS